MSKPLTNKTARFYCLYLKHDLNLLDTVLSWVTPLVGRLQSCKTMDFQYTIDNITEKDFKNSQKTQQASR